MPEWHQLVTMSEHVIITKIMQLLRLSRLLPRQLDYVTKLLLSKLFPTSIWHLPLPFLSDSILDLETLLKYRSWDCDRCFQVGMFVVLHIVMSLFPAPLQTQAMKTEKKKAMKTEKKAMKTEKIRAKHACCAWLPYRRVYHIMTYHRLVANISFQENRIKKSHISERQYASVQSAMFVILNF